MKMQYSIEHFTKNIDFITIQTASGSKLVLTNAGASIVELWVPNRAGEHDNVVLGYEEPDHYLDNTMVLGATIGRHAGRIDRAQIMADNKVIQLPTNEQDNLLHGGAEHFGTVLWDYTVEANLQAITVIFTMHSPAGHNDFPGNVDVNVTMTFTEQNELRIDYNGQSDAETVLNLTNHSYFNLSGATTSPIGDHTLVLHSDYYLQLAEDSIPTYAKAVRNTDFDYNQEKVIASIFNSQDPQAKLVDGFDHPFHLICSGPQIVLSEPHIGRCMEVETNYPYAVVYTANSLREDTLLRENTYAQKHTAICIETQLAPYSLRYKRFDAALGENEHYHYYTNFRFRTFL